MIPDHAISLTEVFDAIERRFEELEEIERVGCPVLVGDCCAIIRRCDMERGFCEVVLDEFSEDVIVAGLDDVRVDYDAFNS